MSEELDEPAIREFLETDYPRLVGGLSLVVGSRAVAEDCVEEALVRAWERLEQGEHIQSLVAWVTTVSLNVSRSWLRRMRAERAAKERLTGAVATRNLGRDEALDIRRALGRLPRRQREVTVLRYYLDMRVEEIARVLHIHDGTAKTNLYRARQALARVLRDREDEGSDVGR